MSSPASNGDLLVRLAYSPDEVAAVTGLCRATIYNRIADGSLPSVKIGRNRRIRHADLEQLLEPGKPVERNAQARRKRAVSSPDAA